MKLFERNFIILQMRKLTKNSNNLIQSKMEIILKKPLWFTVITTLCLLVVTLFAAVGCDNTEILPKHYSVHFAGEGVSIEPQSITQGNYATAPENPEREGSDFSGWFTDNGTFANEWNFKTNIVTQDTTLYARWEENTLPDYPIEVPFTEYSLTSTSCQWTNLIYDDKLIVINRDEILRGYITCTDGSYPAIDFSKHTLLLANGTTPNGIVEISNRLLQLSTNGYKLDVEILLNETEMLGYWITALIVNKLNEESDIELVTILKH
jgi:uncharacterized repeat protein (TIGR02543 family)